MNKPPEPKPEVECGDPDCAWTGTCTELNEIDDYWERVDVGCEAPAGECPKCGCLAYLTDSQCGRDVNKYKDSLAWIVTFINEHPDWFGDGKPEDGAEFEWLANARKLLHLPHEQPTHP